jgi:hypothetical protein
MTVGMKTPTDLVGEIDQERDDTQKIKTLAKIIVGGAEIEIEIEIIATGEMTPESEREDVETILLTQDARADEMTVEVGAQIKSRGQNQEKFVNPLRLTEIS